jgi:hypothetical protein
MRKYCEYLRKYLICGAVLNAVLNEAGRRHVL